MIRFILVLLFVVLFLILTMPIYFILWLIGKKSPDTYNRASRSIVKWGFRMVRFLSGTRLIILGQENIPPDQAVLYVGNHRSYYDIILTYLAVPGMTGYIAKKEMDKIPCLRKWMKAIGCLFLDRDDIRQGMQMILDAVAKVKSGISIFIFPEGTRNKSSDNFLPFKAGSLKIAEKSKCPIIPVAINGSDEVFEKHIPRIVKTTVVIEFGPAIYTDKLDKESKKALADTAFTSIRSMYEKNSNLLIP